jgi:hypothetical protein
VKRFLVTHTHKYDTTNHFFQSERDLFSEFLHMTTDAEEIEFAQELGIHFEPDIGESLEVLDLSTEEYKIIA